MRPDVGIRSSARFDQHVFPILHWWQTHFKEAWPDEIRADRGPLVFNGYYLWGDPANHGKPVAPTAPITGTSYAHDFLMKPAGAFV